MTHTRKERRAPIALKVRFKSATVDDFIEHNAADISRGGIFIKSGKPLPIGTLLKFEFQLSDESRLIHGVGRVVWRREAEDGQAEPPGMGIKFIKMDAESRGLVDSILAQRPAETPGAFEAGQAAPGSDADDDSPKPFFPDTTPASELPAPEDSTQLRHAREFLASALGTESLAEATTTERPEDATVTGQATDPVPASAASSLLPSERSAAMTDPAPPPDAATASATLRPTKPESAPPEEPRLPRDNRPTPASFSFGTPSKPVSQAPAFVDGLFGDDTAPLEEAPTIAPKGTSDSGAFGAVGLFSEGSGAEGPALKPGSIPSDDAARLQAALSSMADTLEADATAQREGIQGSLDLEAFGTGDTDRPEVPRLSSESLADPFTTPEALSTFPPENEPRISEKPTPIARGAAAALSTARRGDAPKDEAAAPVRAVSERPKKSPRLDDVAVEPKQPSLLMPLIVAALALISIVGVLYFTRFGSTPEPDRSSTGTATENPTVDAPRATPTAPQPAADAPEAPPAEEPTEAPEVPTVEVADIDVSVTSTPGGADIVLNGEVLGQAPTTVTLREEPVTLELRLPGHRSEYVSVDPSEGSPVRVTLEPLPYRVSVESLPAGARVRAGSAGDIEAPGTLELPRTPRGDVVLTATLDGHVRQRVVIPKSAFSERNGAMEATATIELPVRSGSRRPRPVRGPRPDRPSPSMATPDTPAPQDPPVATPQPAPETPAPTPTPPATPTPPPEPAPRPAPAPAPTMTPVDAPMIPDNPF